ncbi:cytochrome P450 2J1-like [Acanthaster planci]|uniref:Cytochrome P450 2J1-like n=1 Tax=Acanthaster planci TaxID=133434 RepID=A0A8B7YZF7_ACAPL|nr:cytochrome P450 2J1-like [Acanthaster planci]XP_022098083.1 cytochrome P450 2J1-like [Acanthaster planci]XP_022098084.1 cytochrome P450 2J1-like [Acanthaster planci]
MEDTLTGVTASGWSRWPAGGRSALIGLFVFLLTVFLMLKLRRPRNLPPGPWGWPILGYLPQILWRVAVDKKVAHEFLSELSGRYGDILSFHIAGKLLVVISKSATMREAFGQHQLSNRPEFHVTNNRFPGLGVFAASGQLWVELRRFSLTALRGLGVGKSNFEENISTEAKHLTDWLMEDKGAPIDPTHPLGNALSNVVCTVVFGKRFEYSDAAFKKLLKYTANLMHHGGAGFFVEAMPAVLTKLQPFAFIRFYVQAVDNFFNHFGLLIKEHQEAYDPVQPRDFIDEFLKACEAKEKQGLAAVGLRPINLLRSVADLFIGGTETSATTLRWGLLYMMGYPEIQSRIQQELDAVTGRNRLPALSDKANLPYTEATICEIQRITTILPLSAPHYCAENTTVHGYDIPKGSYVMANLWHSHFDPSVWDDPREFRPERFLDTDGKLRLREEFIPFGNGRRVCLGENLAKMELFIFFSHLLHHFTFKKPSNSPPLSFRGVLGVTWAPMPYTLCAVPRE